jgi:hypothetical protein
VRSCAFCPRDADSREHNWSAWIGDLFNSPGYNFHRFDIKNRNLKTWRTLKLDEKSKVVCQNCNNGWMSDLEARAKTAFSEMIRDGSGICLLSRGIALLAAFAFKCAVISDLSDPRGSPFFSAFERYRFRESLQIPSGVKMWISTFHDPRGRRGVFTSYSTHPNDETFRDLKFNVFTFVAGHLAFQVHSTKWAALHQQGRALPRLELENHWNARATTEFWPNDYGFPITWPPPIQITTNLLQQFIYRWSGNLRIYD